MKGWVIWILMTFLFQISCSWDIDDYELFDLVEEINTNFYSLLGVSENANATEIKKAYRKLSLLLHPDKNDAPDAEIKFRQLVAVYDVLRDNNKRSRYNLVLQNGLPDWKHVAFYYRRVRKMGLAEMSLILFIIMTVGQYVVAWASYLEKKYTLEQLWEAKMKKLQKKQRKGKYDGPAIPDTVPVKIPTPRVWDTLPFQLPRFFWFMITLCPHTVVFMYGYLCNRCQKEEQELWSEEEEVVAEIESRAPRRRKGKYLSPEQTNSSWEISHSTTETEENLDQIESSDNYQFVSGGLWTDDDLSELVRLVKKFPPGSVARWEKISQALQRPVSEVTHMARKVKEDGYRMLRPNEETTLAPGSEDMPRKVKTRSNESTNVLSDVLEWSQPQQKALESALIKYPKRSTIDRWEKIAKGVPGKTKEECMLRYKHLVEVVKRRKETTNGITSTENSI